MTKTAASPPRWSAFDACEGMHVALAASALQDTGVLDALSVASSPERLARRLGLDAAALKAALDLLAERSTLVSRRGAVFRITAAYSPSARFELELYAGALLKPALDLALQLRGRRIAGTRIDLRRHAAAFLRLPLDAAGVVAGIARQLDLKPVLDLGCGAGGLLLSLASTDGTLRGYGIDCNIHMCRAARERVRLHGVKDRIRIIHGDSRKAGSLLPAALRKDFRLLVAGDLANEWFAEDASVLVTWLRDLRRWFPHAVLLVSDYYGRLGTRLRAGRQTLLHDFVQAISGQGIPAADRKGWQALYRKARCRMIHCIEDRTTTRFVHIVAL